MTDLVSGEAVVLELRLAKLPTRALALLLDLLVQLACLIVVFLALGALAPVVDAAMAAAIAVVAGVVIFVGYPVTFETLSRGRTLGKMALGLRVVRDDGGPVRFRQALVRGLAGLIVDFWLLGLMGAVAVFVSLASSKGKRVGDLLAGTVVLRERVPANAGPVAQMPPPLAQWAQSLELSRLPDDLALAARQYLSRSHQLAPQVNENMAQRLAADVAQYVRPNAPPGTPAWAYLAAVVAERRNREMSRMMAQQSAPGQAMPGPVPGPASGPAPGSAAGPVPGPPPSAGEPERREVPTGPDGGFAPPG